MHTVKTITKKSKTSRAEVERARLGRYPAITNILTIYTHTHTQTHTHATVLLLSFIPHYIFKKCLLLIYSAVYSPIFMKLSAIKCAKAQGLIYKHELLSILAGNWKRFSKNDIFSIYIFYKRAYIPSLVYLALKILELCLNNQTPKSIIIGFFVVTIEYI